MFYLIMGRTASGKDTLGLYLNQKGLSGVLSNTTRPPRYPEEDTHKFLSPETARAIPSNQKISRTLIADYEYFVTKEDFAHKQYFIVDPPGLTDLTKNMPDQIFTIIYLYSNYPTRRANYIQRYLKNNLNQPLQEMEKLAKEAFEERDYQERVRFDAFESRWNCHMLQQKDLQSLRYQTNNPQVPYVHILNNNKNLADFAYFADQNIDLKP